MRVLVVDAGRHRERLLNALNARGMETDSAADGVDALRRAYEDAPDVIVASVLLPRMDGYQLLHEWRADPALAKLPFALYSPTPLEPEDRAIAERADADDFIDGSTDDATIATRIASLGEVHRNAGRGTTGVSEDELLAERMEERNVALHVTNERLHDALDVLREQIEAKERLIGERDASVSAMNRAQQELRSTREQLHALITASPLAIIAHDVEGRVTMWNPAAEALFGYTAEEMIGRTAALAPAGREAEFESLKEAMRAGGRFTGLETVRQHKDGSIIDVSISLAPLFLEDGTAAGWVSIIADITDRVMIQQRLQEGAEQSRKVMESTILALGKIVETRDPYTAGHQEAVSKLATAIARELSLPADRIEGIRLAALMHDLGKLHVPAEILSKPGRLSEVEMAVIKIHPQVGGDILSVIDFPWPIAEIVTQHQERLDGSGYPRGLKGEEIMLEARILSVADVVEAMSHHRPYKRSPGLDKALAEIETNRGRLYEADAVDACLRLFREKGFTLENQVTEILVGAGSHMQPP